MAEVLAALAEDMTKSWQVTVHEGLPTEVIFDGAVCKPLSHKPDQSEDASSSSSEQFYYVDNYGLSELLIGLLGALPVFNTATNPLPQ